MCVVDDLMDDDLNEDTLDWDLRLSPLDVRPFFKRAF